MNRKIKLLIASLFLLGWQAGFSQLSFKDYFNDNTQLTYLGIDFTEAQVSGHSDYDLGEMVKWHFNNINQLVLNEPKKYDLDKFFHKSGVQTNIKLVEDRNKKIDPEKLKAASGGKDLTEAAIEKLVKSYDFGEKKGLGVLFIMEKMDKMAEQATISVVFVDMGTGKLLYTERFTAKPGGFGVRNYWAKAVFNVMTEIGDSKYKRWKKDNS